MHSAYRRRNMKSNRAGRMKTRNEFRKRVPDLGYYYIVTDTRETEKNYLEGLKQKLPEKLKDRLVIKVIKAKTEHLIEECLEGIAMEPQYREPWIVFDRDKVMNFDKIILEATSKGIRTGWSNPCIEIWFSSYFGEMKFHETSVSCNDYFSALFRKKTNLEYSKSDKRIYEHLTRFGNEERAIRISKERHRHYMEAKTILPSEMYSCSMLYKLVEEISTKSESNA